MLDLHQGIDRKTFVDSSNLYIYFIDALYLLNPELKIILTVRNGQDFVRSAFSRRWHEHNAFGTVPLRNDRYFSKWDSLTPDPEERLDMGIQEQEGTRRPEMLCLKRRSLS